MQRLEGLLRKAVQDYEMIAPGDRVCVGAVSYTHLALYFL